MKEVAPKPTAQRSDFHTVWASILRKDEHALRLPPVPAELWHRKGVMESIESGRRALEGNDIKTAINEYHSLLQGIAHFTSPNLRGKRLFFTSPDNEPAAKYVATLLSIVAQKAEDTYELSYARRILAGLGESVSKAPEQPDKVQPKQAAKTEQMSMPSAQDEIVSGVPRTYSISINRNDGSRVFEYVSRITIRSGIELAEAQNTFNAKKEEIADDIYKILGKRPSAEFIRNLSFSDLPYCAGYVEIKSTCTISPIFQEKDVRGSIEYIASFVRSRIFEYRKDMNKRSDGE